MIADLQMFSRGELVNYDSDPAYMFIFVDREQLEDLSEGILVPRGYEIAVDDTEEWIRYNREELIREGKAFVAIFQRSTLEMGGFIEPSLVSSRELCDWDKKIDDGFIELRCNKVVSIDPLGYCSLFQAKEKKVGDLTWVL